ncbi:hypothetical protein GCM10010967_12890 [Dyadobacter beijingensis]|uniref:WG containing repeat-containing protein n=1 Tax=Dyadobacter beijingensis TaxID=365489 RepID=A0ABQ2HJX3_9BACT|nr:hypothetical protein [Dyadobacter beijingensis]GGM82635.1 hypothetical protein GCM10010967_12890 [Dyadobacter beijingensis]
MRQFFLLITILFITSAQTCSSQDAQPQMDSKEYQSCCGTQPVEFTFSAKKVYMPNVFTPNRDGVNDYYAPNINDVITDVWGFTIYSAEGDTVIFQKPHFNTKMKLEEYGWNGLRPDGSQYKGLFKFKMRVDDKQANKHVVTGQACAIQCGPDAKIFQSKSGCFFPVQASKGVSGTLDKSVSTLEKGCF